MPVPGGWGLATLLAGALVAAVATLGFTINGFAPDGRFPLLFTLLFAVGAVLVALTPRHHAVLTRTSEHS
ncbi:MAG: acyltransferase, partial [Actinomycetota bacterium]|nr:acyltransferase [Actinomycetota bacterium]